MHVLQGFYYYNQPVAISEYRDKTNAHASTIYSGTPTFKCAKCKSVKHITGRKAMVKGYSKAGYKCADCVDKEIQKCQS